MKLVQANKKQEKYKDRAHCNWFVQGDALQQEKWFLWACQKCNCKYCSPLLQDILESQLEYLAWSAALLVVQLLLHAAYNLNHWNLMHRIWTFQIWTVHAAPAAAIAFTSWLEMIVGCFCYCQKWCCKSYDILFAWLLCYMIHFPSWEYIVF